MQKCRQCHQIVRRRFLMMSATIGCIYAPLFDHANLQGVHSDFLEGFKSSGVVQGVDAPLLRTFFARAASAFLLYVL
jgi:hypothetical protein